MGVPDLPPAAVRPPPRPALQGDRAAARPLFAPVLVAEEITDRLQRATMNDEAINPLVRMVNRIHVVEEARHVRFAREEVARLDAALRPGRQVDQQPVLGRGRGVRGQRR